jgi:hypothetical protein
MQQRTIGLVSARATRKPIIVAVLLMSRVAWVHQAYAATVQITSPTAAATVSGSVTISSRASANVKRVDYYLDATLIGSSTSGPNYSISWDSTTVADGSHTLLANAYGSGGSSSLSQACLEPKGLQFCAQGANSRLKGPNGRPLQLPPGGTCCVSQREPTSARFAAEPVRARTITATIFDAEGAGALYKQGSNLSLSALYRLAGAMVAAAVAWIAGPAYASQAIKITSPSAGATVSGMVAISAQASSHVKEVKFYTDGRWIATVKTRPYSIEWNSTSDPNGSNNLSANGYGGSGKLLATTSETINVSNTLPSPTPTPTPKPTPTPTPTATATPTPTPTSTPTPVGLDQYGGVTNVACPNGAQPHFYTEKIGDRWWLCDPAGNGFFMKGVTNVAPNVDVEQQNLDVPAGACYGAGQPAPCCTGVGTGSTCSGKYWNNIAPNPYVTDPTNPSMWTFNWVMEQINRLRTWGFNTLSDDSYALLTPSTTSSNWNTPDHTIPAPFRMPFAFIKNTTHYAFSNEAGCGLPTSPIKDMENGLTPGNQSLTGYYDMGDYFDPHYAACINGQANPANDSILQNATQGPHNDYLLYITIDEGGQVGGVLQGPAFPTIGGDTPSNPVHAAPHPGWDTLVTAPTQSANSRWNVSSYADNEVYSKVKFADFMVTRYAAPDCTGPGTPFAACTGRGTAANGSVDSSCTGSSLPSYCMGDTYVGASEMALAANRLNAGWSSSYSTLATSDSSCASNLAQCLIGNRPCTGPGTPYSWCTGSAAGNATAYASWGTGTGLLDENGRHSWLGDACTLGANTSIRACGSSSGSTYAAETAGMQT